MCAETEDQSGLPPLSGPRSKLEIGAQFGTHQFTDHLEDSIVCCAWFVGGLRIVDVANPVRPEEIGYFIPEPRAGHAAPQSNDVEVDGRGDALPPDCGQMVDIVRGA